MNTARPIPNQPFVDPHVKALQELFAIKLTDPIIIFVNGEPVVVRP